MLLELPMGEIFACELRYPIKIYASDDGLRTAIDKQKALRRNCIYDIEIVLET